MFKAVIKLVWLIIKLEINAPNKTAIAPIDEFMAFANFNCEPSTKLGKIAIFAG